MAFPISHKTVIIIDDSDYFCSTHCNVPLEFDVVSKCRQPSGIIPLSPIGKSLWTSAIEAISEYCRIVWDIYPNCERVIRFVCSHHNSSHHINEWQSAQQNLQSAMQSMAKWSAISHMKVNHSSNHANDKSISIHAFEKAIEALCECTDLQITHQKTNEQMNGMVNRGRIICISSFRNDSHIQSLEQQFKEVLYEQNKMVKTKINDNLMAIDFCELVFINTYPVDDQNQTSKIVEIPKHEISPLISSEVHSVKSGRFLAAKLAHLVLSHYDFSSTTVTGIPMKEEQNASSSANYDVEIVHPIAAHYDLIKSGSFSAEVCVKAYREGFAYDTITLKWCTPRTNSVELHYCTNAHRITSVDVNSRPSSCLTNFLLSGRAVMLEMPRLKGAKVMSHMLASHNGELYIHTLGTGRSTLEDPPSISEGSGGRVTDYRINDFGEMMKKNRLVVCRHMPTANKDVLFPIEKAKQSLMKQTVYWPLVIGHTILFNIQSHVQPFLNLITKHFLTEEEVLECKKVIYYLVGMESKGTNLPIPTIGVRGKGPKREELYRMLWNEVEYFVRAHSVSPEHNTILNCLLECRLKPDQYLTNNSMPRSSANENSDESESNKKQTQSIQMSTNKNNESEWAWKELNEWAKNELNQMNESSEKLNHEPVIKKFKANNAELSPVINSATGHGNGPQSLLQIWTNKMNDANSRRKLEFSGRTGEDGASPIAKLYKDLNNDKTDS